MALSTRSLIDRSGTTTANTVTPVMPANPSRQSVSIVNVSDTTIWINLGSPASAGAGSYPIAPNGEYCLTSADFGLHMAITVFCSVSGKAYTAKEGVYAAL